MTGPGVRAPGAPASQARGRAAVRASALDRHLAGSEDVVVMGPLAMPPISALQQAAAAMARDPHSVLGLARSRACDDGRRERDVPAAPEEEAPGDLGQRLVVHRPDLDPDVVGFGAHARGASALRPASEPAVWVVAGPWLTLVVDHAVGDAAAMNTLATGLIAHALGRPQPQAAHGARWLLARALLHTYGRRPGRLLGAARAAWRSRAAGPLGVRVAGGRAGRADAVHAVASEEATAALRAWQREAGRALSPLAVHTVLVHRALEREGVALARQVLTLFDARAHLPAGVVATGNFGVGVGVDVGSPSSVATADAGLREAFELGRPLTAMVGGAVVAALTPLTSRVRTRLVPRRPDAGASPDTGAGPTRGAALLIVTALGRDPQVEALPWAGAPGERVFSAVSAPSPGAITLAVTFLDGRRQYSLSFDPCSFDAGALRRALAAVASDPLPLLDV